LPARRARRRLTALFAILGGSLACAAPAAADATLRPAIPVGSELAPAGPAVGTAPAVSAVAAEHALEEAEATLSGDGGHASTALAELAVALPSLEGADRRRGEALLARPTDGPSDPYGDGYTVPFRAAASAHYCYFWVESGRDAVPLVDANANAIPDYIELLASISEEVWTAEHTRLGWPTPPSDGTRGCNAGDGRARTDVYTKNVGGQGLYGYAAVDPGQPGHRLFSFLVLDNDQAEFAAQYGGIVPPMQVTMAHEYNHVLHFGIDAIQDGWMKESVATWMEEIVYPAVNDYLQYLRPWAREVETPLTTFGNRSLKVYGSAVWNHFLSKRLGNGVVRNAWTSSLKTNPQSFAAKAYHRAIKGAPGRRDFVSEFVRFAAATAEWRSTSIFPDSGAYPEVKRTGTLATAEPRYDAYKLDHTTFRLANVPDRSGAAVKLELRAPRGVAFGLALVGRIGNGAGARVISVVRGLPNGGVGAVRLSRPGRFSRITAVLVNADFAIRGFSAARGDWIYTGDDSRIQAATSKLR
jgi:hypothetical protein